MVNETISIKKDKSSHEKIEWDVINKFKKALKDLKSGNYKELK